MDTDAIRPSMPAGGTEAPPHSAGVKPSVLIVDDYPGTLAALQAVLESRDLVVELAGSGSEALKRLETGDFACVLLDVRMPGIDGLETAALIRKRERLRDLPILFMTSSEPSLAEVSQGYALGAVDFIARPLEPDILKAKVRKVVDLYLGSVRARQEKDQELHRGRERLSLLLAQVPAALWTTDENLRVVHCDGAVYGDGGIPQAENFLGSSPETAGSDRALEAHRRALAGQEGTYEIEFAGRVFEARVRPMRDARGTVVGVVGVAVDVASRRRAESVLLSRAERAERYQAALLTMTRTPPDNADAAIRRLTEIDARAMEVERVGLWLFSDDRASLRCRDLHRRSASVHESGVTLDARSYPRYFEALEESRVVAARDARTDARTAEFAPGYLDPLGITSMMDVPIRVHGRLVGVLCHEHVGPPRDWTPEDQAFAGSVADLLAQALVREERVAIDGQIEARIAERTEELRRINAELEMFTKSAGHDLRAPLRAMAGLAEILILDHAGNLDAEGKDLLSRIARLARETGVFVNNLLDFTHLSQVDIPVCPVDLDRVVDAVLNRFRSEIESRRAAVQVERPLPTVQGHEVALIQAVANLFSNALKFVAPGKSPAIRLRSEQKGARWRLWVEDEGIGISEAGQKRLFRSFERLAPNEYPGTGMGLGIVRRAVERMGGTVGVESQPGQGSRFYIEMAAADPGSI